jgi:hypothetical protein
LFFRDTLGLRGTRCVPYAATLLIRGFTVPMLRLAVIHKYRSRPEKKLPESKAQFCKVRTAHLFVFEDLFDALIDEDFLLAGAADGHLFNRPDQIPRLRDCFAGLGDSGQQFDFAEIG